MDDKVEEVQRLFAEGNSKHEVAKILGYKNYKGLHAYMIRHGYAFDREKGNYINPEDKTTIVRVLRMGGSLSAGRETMIISLIAKGKDVREVAKQMHFGSHKEMAAYMKSGGYIWDSKLGNYKRERDNIIDVVEKIEEIDQEEENVGEALIPSPTLSEIEEDEAALLSRYSEILKILEKNKERLRELLASESKGKGTIPRYTLSGINVTKSVHMVTNLDQLTRAYSEEKNIPQREIFQVALIEFFRKYGYQREIDALLNSR